MSTDSPCPAWGSLRGSAEECQNILKSSSVTPKKTEGCNWCHSTFNKVLSEGFTQNLARLQNYDILRWVGHAGVLGADWWENLGVNITKHEKWKVPTTCDYTACGHGFIYLWRSLKNGWRLHFYICTRYRKKVTTFKHISFPVRFYSLTGAPSCPLVSVRPFQHLCSDKREHDSYKSLFFFLFTDDEQVSAVWGATLELLLQ